MRPASRVSPHARSTRAAPRPVSDPVRPARLSLGPASRLLGVDPDTLRRWADEGRVEAFTTPGGHRRFERARPGAARRRPAHRRDRRRAGEPRRHPRPPDRGLPPQLHAPTATRPHPVVAREPPSAIAFRRRRAPPRRGARRPPRRRPADATAAHAAEAEATALVDVLARRLARAASTSLTEAVSMFVAARRPFLAELPASAAAGRSTPSRLGRLYDARRACSTGCCSGSSRRHQEATARRDGRRSVVLPALTSILALVFARRAVRPVARAARRLPADLGVRDAVLRHRRRLRGHRRAPAAGTSRSTGRGT